uniref:Putative secreted peptide n=1 Tax=Anopheles braziliensis TaxID=58242 RepID=A0A2M3ZNV8_9DIPT
MMMMMMMMVIVSHSIEVFAVCIASSTTSTSHEHTVIKRKAPSRDIEISFRSCQSTENRNINLRRSHNAQHVTIADRWL